MSGLSLRLEIYKLPRKKCLERHQLLMYRDMEEAAAGTGAEVEQRELAVKKMRESRVHPSYSFLFFLLSYFEVKMHLLQKF